VGALDGLSQGAHKGRPYNRRETYATLY